MKPSPDNRFAYRLRMMRTWGHLRNWRGHNVHSPFAYSLIRKVILPHGMEGTEHRFFEQARAHGVPRRASVQLQNLQRHCPEHRILLVPADAAPQPGAAPENDRTIHCILHPRLTGERLRQCKEAIARHNGMSMDNRRYILLFHDSRLSKKHYRL